MSSANTTPHKTFRLQVERKPKENKKTRHEIPNGTAELYLGSRGDKQSGTRWRDACQPSRSVCSMRNNQGSPGGGLITVARLGQINWKRCPSTAGILHSGSGLTFGDLMFPIQRRNCLLLGGHKRHRNTREKCNTLVLSSLEKS